MKRYSKALILALSLLLTLIIIITPFTEAQETPEILIAQINQNITYCYTQVSQAEKNGANITALTQILNNAAALLSKAQQANVVGNFSAAQNYATRSQSLLSGFSTKVTEVQRIANEKRNDDFYLQTILPLIATAIIVSIGSIILVILRKKHAKSSTLVSLILLIAFLALVSTSPISQRLLVYPQTEFLTEFSMLGPQHSTINYPKDISIDENSKVFLNVTNNLGSCAYYQIQVKFRNETQPAPDSLNRTASSLAPIYKLNQFIPNNENIEIPISFSLNYYILDSKATINSLAINDVTIPLTAISSWNPDRNLFFSNLIFELWTYNATSQSFQYSGQFVDLKLNLT